MPPMVCWTPAAEPTPIAVNVIGAQPAISNTAGSNKQRHKHLHTLFRLLRSVPVMVILFCPRIPENKPGSGHSNLRAR